MERVVVLVSGGLAVAALATMVIGVSPSEVAEPVDYPIETRDGLDRPKLVRPIPRRPRPLPDSGVTERPSGLKWWDIERGVGAPPTEGQVVQVDYTAWLESGMAVETTSDGLSPLRFVIGAGLVPPALDEGVRGMSVGGKRQLIAPPELAYGDEGVLNRIPPGAVLTYELTLTDHWSVPDTPPPAADWTVLPSGVRISDLVVGGGRVLQPRRVAYMDYAMWADGALVGSSFDQPQPMRARVGVGALLEGWEQGLVDLRVGGRRLIEVPPELAYGTEGSGTEIPPDASLLIEVQLRRVR